MTREEEKALNCKYFYYTPLCTALICKKKNKELKSGLHGIKWDGKECENCAEYKPIK